MSPKRKRRLPRIRQYKDVTFVRNGTTIEIRIVAADKLVYYRVLAEGPYFLEDAANMRKIWTKSPGWRFLPWLEG